MKKKNYDARIEIRLSEHEKQAIRNWAKEHGQSVSELTRQYYRTLTGGNR